MRVTLNSSLNSYLINLNNSRERFNVQNERIGTGKEFQTPSDKPRIVGELKRLQNSIRQNEVFAKNVEDGLTDTQVVEAALQNFETTLLAARDVAQEAVNPINSDKLDVLGDKFFNIVGDLIDIANFEFDGRFAFSGTLTTRASITPAAPESNNLPFELVEDPALVSADNPLGLRVAFKGNNEERLITTSANTTERVNTLAQDAFGGSGVQVFDDLLEAYNIMAFKQDGTQRTSDDRLEPDEADALRAAIKNIGDSIDTLNSEIGRLGGVNNRMTAISERLTFENTRLDQLRSLREDADLIDAALMLRKEEFALNATLGVGSSLFQPSLLDFLR